MDAVDARETISAKAVIVVVLPEGVLDRGISEVVDSKRKTVEDDCAGGIVRFSLGSDGH